MSDESQLQIRPKGSDSSLVSISKTRSSLIARGRKDAAMLNDNELCRQAAEQGTPGEQLTLGTMYDCGEGVPQDYAEAANWYRKAAEQGLPEAAWSLALHCEYLLEDHAEAARWYRLCAEQGSPEAQYKLGKKYETGEGLPQDLAEAVRWYRSAAEQGDEDAEFKLAEMYSNGAGVTQDYVEAMMWYRRCGGGAAQNNIGVMYARGQGVAQDYAEAVQWWRKAAEHDATAQGNLGKVYARGEGVVQDRIQAYMWLSLAAASEPWHAAARDAVAAEMTPAQIAEAQRLAVLFEEERRRRMPDIDIMAALKRALEARRSDSHKDSQQE